MFILKLHIFLNFIVIVWHVISTIEDKDIGLKDISLFDIFVLAILGWIILLKVFIKTLK